MKRKLCGGSHNQGSREWQQVAGLKDIDGLTAMQLARQPDAEPIDHTNLPPDLLHTLEVATGLRRETNTNFFATELEEIGPSRHIRRFASDFSHASSAHDEEEAPH